jgi:hypothetical protein
MTPSEEGQPYFVVNQKCKYIRKRCHFGFSVCLLHFLTISSYRCYVNSVLKVFTNLVTLVNSHPIFASKFLKILGLSVPVAARSKVWICDRLPADIMGSNPAGAWMLAFYECCVLSGRNLCDEPIICPEESYQL